MDPRESLVNPVGNENDEDEDSEWEYEYHDTKTEVYFF